MDAPLPQVKLFQNYIHNHYVYSVYTSTIWLCVKAELSGFIYRSAATH